MVNALQKETPVDYFSLLPTEIIVKILKDAPLESQTNFLRSCKVYYAKKKSITYALLDDYHKMKSKVIPLSLVAATAYVTPIAAQWLYEKINSNSYVPNFPSGSAGLQIDFFLLNAGAKPRWDNCYEMMQNSLANSGLLKTYIAANPNCINRMGETLLTCIVGDYFKREKYWRHVPLLLEAGVDPRIKVQKGPNKGMNASDILKSLRSAQHIVQELLPLLESRVDVLNKKDKVHDAIRGLYTDE